MPIPTPSLAADSRPVQPGMSLADAAVLTAAALGLAVVTAVTYVQRPGEPGIALFWPSAGVGLALAVRHGWAGLLATALGMALWAVGVMGWSLAAGVVTGLAASVGPAWVWWRMRELWQGAGGSLAHLPVLLRFLRVQGLGGSPLAASVGTLGLWVTGHWPAGMDALSVWAIYWLLETCGSLLFAPVGLWLVAPARAAQGQQPSAVTCWAQWRQVALQHRLGLLMTLALIVKVVALLAAGQYLWAQAALYGLLPLLVLVALRAPPFWVHSLLLGAAALVLFSLAHLKRQPQWLGDDGLFLAFVLYLLAGAGVVLVVAATMEERRRSEQRLARAALVDALTGLGNEAALLQRLHELRTDAAVAGAAPLAQLVVAVSAGAEHQRAGERGVEVCAHDDCDMAQRLGALPLAWYRVGMGRFRGVWVGPQPRCAEVVAAVAGVCAQPSPTLGAAHWSVAAASVAAPQRAACPPQVQLDVLAEAELRALQFRRVEHLPVSAEAISALQAEAQVLELLRAAVAQYRLVLVA